MNWIITNLNLWPKILRVRQIILSNLDKEKNHQRRLFPTMKSQRIIFSFERTHLAFLDPHIHSKISWRDVKGIWKIITNCKCGQSCDSHRKKYKSLVKNTLSPDTVGMGLIQTVEQKASEFFLLNTIWSYL